MAYNDIDGYNAAFNDQDAQQLISYAGRSPAEQPYTCGWVVCGAPCGIPVIGNMFSAHLKEFHGVTGHDKTKLCCGWVRCGLQMNKESILRHVVEMHLQMKYICPRCGEDFTRKNTLSDHMKKRCA